MQKATKSMGIIVEAINQKMIEEGVIPIGYYEQDIDGDSDDEENSNRPVRLSKIYLAPKFHKSSGFATRAICGCKMVRTSKANVPARFQMSTTAVPAF